MIGLGRVSQVLAVLAIIQAQGSQRQTLAAWERFRSLAAPPLAEQTPELKEELFAYVRSLFPEDVLTAAREGCIAGENKPKLTLDWERKAAAGSNALLCLEIYFGVLFQDEGRKQACEEMAGKVVKLVADRDEIICLRRAVVMRLSYSEKTPFQLALMDYPAAHPRKVDAILGAIIKRQDEEADLRREAISALKRGIHRQVRSICRSDLNVREAIREKRKQTDKVVNVSQLVRSGEVTLTDETVKALEPIGGRIRANVKLLGAILADEENAPEDLRKEARDTLEGYRKSALAGIDDEVEKALQESVD